MQKKAKVTKKSVKKTTKRTTKKSSKLEPKVEPLDKKTIKQMAPGHHPIEIMHKAIIVLSIFGLLVAGYLIYLHYKPEASTICQINNRFDCDVVNKSVYSKFLGIPNSIIGAAGYLYFIISTMIILKGYNLSRIHYRLRTRHLVIMTFLFALIGEGFSLYLLYVEAFVLYAYCVFCLASLAIMTAIFILSIIILLYCNRCSDIMRRIHYKARGNMCRYCG